AVTLILVVPMILMAAAFVHQGLEMAHSLQQQLGNGHFDWANDAWTSLQSRFSADSTVDLSTVLKNHAEEFAKFLASKLGIVLQNIARFLFDLAVMILALFYLFRDGEDVMKRIRNVLPFEEEHRERIISEAHELIFASVFSTLATSAVHGLVGGIMFWILGISAPLFWGVMMALLSMVPVIG